MQKRIITIIIAFIFTFGVFVSARSANPVDLGMQTASIWDSILSWFSFSDNNNEDNTNSDGEQNDDIINPSDLDFDSQDSDYINENDTYLQNEPTFNFGSDNLSCLPNIKRSDQNILISYSCPSGYNLSESNFGASGNYGIIKANTDENSLYIKCKSENSEKIYTCKIQEFSPIIEVFKITPANPTAGNTFQVSLKTSGMQNCVLFNSRRSFKKEGTEIQFSTEAFENDIIYLDCTDKAGLNHKAQISY